MINEYINIGLSRSFIGPFVGAALPVFDYYVVPLKGQSNEVGRGSPIDVVLDATDADICQPDTKAGAGLPTALITAADPLKHWDAGNDTVGMGLTYGKLLLAQVQVLNPTAKVVLVPCAKGATGFSGDDWNVGDPQYDEAITRVNKVMELCAALGTVTLHSIVWHQIEQDLGQTSDFYSTHLDNMIARMRNELTGATSSTPFIVGDCDESVSSFPARTALMATPTRVPYTAATSSVGITDIGDGVHFDPAGQREIAGRYFDNLSSLSGGLGISAPSPVTDLAVTGSAGAIDLTWSSPSNGGSAIINYIVEYKLSSDSEWTEFYHSSDVSATTSATIGGLTEEEDYDARVKPVNHGFVCPTWSNIDSATTLAGALRPTAATLIDNVVMDFTARNSACTDGSSQTITNLATSGTMGDAWNGSVVDADPTDTHDIPFTGTPDDTSAKWAFSDVDQGLTMKASNAFTNMLHRSDSTQDWSIIMQLRPDYSFKVLFATTAHAVSQGFILWLKGYQLRIRTYGSGGGISTNLDTTVGLTVGQTGRFCLTYNGTTRAYTCTVDGGTIESGTVTAWTNTVAVDTPAVIMNDTAYGFGYTSPSEFDDFIMTSDIVSPAETDSLFTMLRASKGL